MLVTFSSLDVILKGILYFNINITLGLIIDVQNIPACKSLLVAKLLYKY